MNEVKSTLKRMAFYYLLLAIAIIPNANLIPDVFPIRTLSSIYLLILSVCLIFYYSHRVAGSGGLPFMMKSISWLCMLLILFRGIKYSSFAKVDVLARHTWYFYYVPMLLIPLFLFCVSLLVAPKRDFRIPKGWYAALAVTVAFILIILTNDFHQLIFRFNSNFEDWNNDYSYGLLFYFILVWRYALYIASIVILVINCRISNSKKNAWLTLIPFFIGAVLNILLITGKMPKHNGANLIELPEVIIFTAAIVLECCIQLGLIPTNRNYDKLFCELSIFAQITDKKGKPVFSSSSAVPLTSEQINLQSGSRVDSHIVLRKMEVPGGWGFWQDDMSELDSLNEKLADAKEELAQEAELIRLRNELKEKQTKTEQRALVYDTIAKHTQRQSQLISQLAEAARLSGDPELKEENRKRITLTGAYIKRYANLMLLSQENNFIEAGELGLSVSEVLRYLNFCGIPSELFNSAHGAVPSATALSVFETFETLLETNYTSLRGAFVNLSSHEDKVIFKLALENLSQPLSENAVARILACGVTTETNTEDDVTYLCFTLPKGGGAK